METAGFYKLDTTQLLYSLGVVGVDYTLVVEDYTAYQYPIDGWYWFDSIDEAKYFFNIIENQ